MKVKDSVQLFTLSYLLQQSGMIQLDRLKNIKCFYSVHTQCMKKLSVVWPVMHWYRSTDILVSQNGAVERKGLPGKLLIHINHGWIFSTFVALCLKTSLSTCALIPTEERVASTGYCKSLTHHSWLCSCIWQGNIPCCGFAIILLGTGISNDNRSCQGESMQEELRVWVQGDGPAFSYCTCVLPFPTLWVACSWQ